MVPCVCLCPLSKPIRRFVGNFFDSPDTFRCIRVLATVVAQEGGGVIQNVLDAKECERISDFLFDTKHSIECRMRT